jgi:hypothetical protein
VQALMKSLPDRTVSVEQSQRTLAKCRNSIEEAKKRILEKYGDEIH